MLCKIISSGLLNIISMIHPVSPMGLESQYYFLVAMEVLKKGPQILAFSLSHNTDIVVVFYFHEIFDSCHYT